MKRFGVIASLSIGVVGVSGYAVADRLNSVWDSLPLQSAEDGFDIPTSATSITVPFAEADGDPVVVATATPFSAGPGSADEMRPSGAAEALEAIAARSPGVAFSSPAFRQENPAVLAFTGPADLLTTAASSSAKPVAAPASGDAGTQDAPKSLATKLFDTEDETWRSSIYSDNRLIGSIVAADGSPSDPASLVEAVKGARYVLLGEIHDNPDHHRLQAGIVRRVAEDDAKPALVFEMIPAGFSELLRNLDASTPGNLTELARTLRWNERGWPDFSIYEPIFKAAADNQLPIRAGDLDRDTIRNLSAGGLDAVPAVERARLGLDLPVDPALSQDLKDELAASHCGLLPQAALAPMEFVQRLRDGSMAASMIEAAKENGSAILIAGSGHARTDRGVPAVIEGLTGTDESVAVQMVEVSSSEANAPLDYGLSNDTPAPFDFTIFTPRANTTDHCAELKAKMTGAADKPAPAEGQTAN
ncbi:hypothetical protein DYI37_07620 [Fulvimarina endophytica]|uniref:Haem-binding uptake Tiki superfamily ChaN domain-containing protein n=1 Tax=Fulvimarina endophytica TaxID=2293836 RepID=A0A371X4P0_9HYPH|nr:ChaN family lipoprotein [Fulvimarina endophytica]RFC64206.1 hypothetical protein DYI37_07620 [Fulvimarina endophytica]